MKGFLNLFAIFVAALLLISWSIILYPDVWSKVRSYVPVVPYCTTNDLAIGCEYKAPASFDTIHTIVTEDPVVVTLRGVEPVDFLNTLCNHARDGGNVLAIVNTAPVDDINSIAESLVSCGVKVKRYYVPETIAVSPAGLFISSIDVALFTDCNKAVSYTLSSLQQRWKEI